MFEVCVNCLGELMVEDCDGWCCVVVFDLMLECCLVFFMVVVILCD